MDRVRVVVVGVGHLGTYHLQKVVADDRATLVGIVDTDRSKRERVAAEYGVPGVESIAEVEAADAVIVAAPTTAHRQLTEAALERGFHVLVEKPLAATAAEASELAVRANDTGRWLQVGHTERFNPAVDAALRVADRPRYIVTERLGPFSGRSTDVDVILDLMIHDLDIVASLVKAPLTEVRAVGVPVITSDVDMAAARLQFADGTVAQLSAGRASMEPARKIRLFTVERYVSIDCSTREVKSVRRLPAAQDSEWPQITGEPVEVSDGDALALQDGDFFACILEGRPPRVDGAAGARALELAEAVRDALTMPVPPELLSHD
jgi:predicted dehydrogenase